MARRTEWGIRDKIASVWAHRRQMVNVGRWTVRKLLAGVSANDALEVFDIETGQSIMALTQNDRSEYRPWDVGYFTMLHNLFPEMANYIGDLEGNNAQMAGVIERALAAFKEYEKGWDTPPPRELMIDLHAALACWTSEAARHRVPKWEPPPADRRRAIRIASHDGPQ